MNIYVDGGCPNNGQPDAVGYASVAVYDGNNLVDGFSRKVVPAPCTNNIAEYAALIYGLALAGIVGKGECVFWTDSVLVCEQVNGRWKVDNSTLFSLCECAKSILAAHPQWKVKWITREEIVKRLGH